MLIGKIISGMIAFYRGSLHDINHFLKVYAFAKAIGETENLPPPQQRILEIAAVVHDISCPLCREKYGSARGDLQELEGPALAKEFLEAFDLNKEEIERICWLVGHHHTTECADSADHRILLEADFLVNAAEQKLPREDIEAALRTFFCTESGISLLKEIYLNHSPEV